MPMARDLTGPAGGGQGPTNLTRAPAHGIVAPMTHLPVTCPVCGAAAGSSCEAARGTFSKERGGQPVRNHGERVDAAVLAHVTALPRSNDCATYAELAKALGLAQSTVKGSVARLVDRGEVAILEHRRRAKLRRQGVVGAGGWRYVEHLVYVPKK